jgi:hypothetical protein
LLAIASKRIGAVCVCDAATAYGSNHWQQPPLRFAYKNAITTNKLHDDIERTEQKTVSRA